MGFSLLEGTEGFCTTGVVRLKLAVWLEDLGEDLGTDRDPRLRN